MISRLLRTPLTWVVIVVLVAFAAWTIVRGRRLGRQLPPEDRRWL